jgi:hypothetical protein
MRTIQRVRGQRAAGLAIITWVGALLPGGCTADQHHRDIPPAAVKPVNAYGLTLDENATPEQVAFVVLRSIADDVAAAQAHDHDSQREALRTTHALIACGTVETRLLQAENLAPGGRKRKSFGDERNEKLFDFARQLAPIVSHYVKSFDTDFESARRKMRAPMPADPNLVRIFYEAAHDPAASDVRQRDPVIIELEMAREKVDGKTYWRLAKIGFAGRPSAATGTRTAASSEPARTPTPAPATAPR